MKRQHFLGVMDNSGGITPPRNDLDDGALSEALGAVRAKCGELNALEARLVGALFRSASTEHLVGGINLLRQATAREAERDGMAGDSAAVRERSMARRQRVFEKNFPSATRIMVQ